MGDNLKFFTNATNILQKASQYTGYCQENYDAEAKDENSIFGQYNQDFLKDINLSKEEYINLLKTDGIDQDGDGILDVSEAADLSKKIANGSYADKQETFGAAIAYVLGATVTNGASMKELYGIDSKLFDTGTKGAKGEQLLSRGQLKKGDSAENIMKLGIETAVMGGWNGTFTNKDYATNSGYTKDQLAEAVSKAFQNDGMLTPDEVNNDPILRQMFRERNLQDNNDPQTYNQLGKDNQFNSLFYGYQEHLTKAMPGANIITDDQAARIQKQLGTNTVPPQIQKILEEKKTSNPTPGVCPTNLPAANTINPAITNPTGTGLPHISSTTGDQSVIPTTTSDPRLSAITQQTQALRSQAQSKAQGTTLPQANATTTPTPTNSGDSKLPAIDQQTQTLRSQAQSNAQGTTLPHVTPTTTPSTINQPANTNVNPVTVENNVSQTVTNPENPEASTIKPNTTPAEKELTDGQTKLTAEDKASIKTATQQTEGGVDKVVKFGNGDIKEREMQNPEGTTAVRYVQKSQNFWQAAGNLLGGIADVAIGGPLSFTGWGRRANHDGMEKIMSVFTGTQHEAILTGPGNSQQMFSSGSRYDVQRHIDESTGGQSFFANAAGSQDKPWWNPF